MTWRGTVNNGRGLSESESDFERTCTENEGSVAVTLFINNHYDITTNNGPKRHQMCDLGPRYAFFFICANFVSLISISKVISGMTRFVGAATRTGPNDARRVVWVLGALFLKFLPVL